MEEQRPRNEEIGNEEKRSELMFNRWYGGRHYRFISDIPLPITEKAMLFAIASYMYVDEEVPFSQKTAWPSYDTIAKDVGASKSSILRAIKALDMAGFVRKERRTDVRGADRSNVYSIEPTLPIFSEYFHFNRMLKSASFREMPRILMRLNRVSEELSDLLQLDRFSLDEIALQKPGLFEKRIRPWMEAEQARDTQSSGGVSHSYPPGSTMTPGGVSHSYPPGSTMTPGGVSHSYPPGSTMTPKDVIEDVRKENKTLSGGEDARAKYGLAIVPRSKLVQFTRDNFDVVFVREGRSRDESMGFDFAEANSAIADVVAQLGFTRTEEFAKYALAYKHYNRRLQIKPSEIPKILARFLTEASTNSPAPSAPEYIEEAGFA